MSDLPTEVQAPLRPVLAEPEEDERGDEIVLVRGGFVRITIAGVLYKLRRPFLGELRELEATLDAAQTELMEWGRTFREQEEEEKALAESITVEAQGDDVTPERLSQLDLDATTLSVKINDRIKEAQRFARTSRENWWKQAFTMLTPPGHPEPPSMPAWVGDAQLVNEVLEHWQSSPLARGHG